MFIPLIDIPLSVIIGRDFPQEFYIIRGLCILQYLSEIVSGKRAELCAVSLPCCTLLHLSLGKYINCNIF